MMRNEKTLQGELTKPVEITSVCKADILTIRDENGKLFFNIKDIMDLDDIDMKRIASELADDYCEQLFWSSLQTITENIINYKNNKK